MATTTDHEDKRFRLVSAIHHALTVVRAEEYGSQKAHDAHMAAFDVAKVEGWDWEDDEDFTLWVLKATEQEALAEGLVRALGFPGASKGYAL